MVRLLTTPACFAVLAAVAVHANVLSLIQMQAATIERPHAPQTRKHNENGWNFIYLDKTEVDQKGSYCMDGSTPGYWHKPGTEEDKWTISFEGGAMYCYDDSSCLQSYEGFKKNPVTRVDLELYDSDEFENYNHVQLSKCDGGIWMSDASSPVVIGGQQTYLRGKRILDHTFDTLQRNSTLATAKEVLLTGGSGGGHATFLLADYVKGLLPASVQKYGSLPMSGWYPTYNEHLDEIVSLHSMSTDTMSSCGTAMGVENYKCLDPAVSYKYSSTPTFVVQMLDSQSIAGAYVDNTSLAEEAKTAWTNCLEADRTSSCNSESVGLLENYLEEFVANIKSMSKYSEKGSGGFLSTCTKHVFYKVDEYTHYANNGVTVESAISDWWRNLGTAPSKWHLPCELKVQTPGDCQCESSCAYDSGQTDF